METLENVKIVFFTGCLVCMAVLMMLCLLRAVKGPRITDRLVAVNMIGTMVMVVISIMAIKLKEGYLVDICLIYALVSFLAVVVLAKVYMAVYLRQRARDERLRKEAEAKAAKKFSLLEDN